MRSPTARFLAAVALAVLAAAASAVGSAGAGRSVSGASAVALLSGRGPSAVALRSGGGASRAALSSGRVASAGALPSGPAPVAPSGQLAPGAVPALSHVVVIVMENHTSSQVTGAPYIASLIKAGALATNYSAIVHPSLGNYMGMTSGITWNLKDCKPSASCHSTANNLGNQLTTAGKTWKGYAEDMPSPCYGKGTGYYVVRHNPWPYYTDLSTQCVTHDVPYTALAADLAATLPTFSFISPNLIHDMDDGTVAQGDAWLAANVPPILNSTSFKSSPSLLVVTWDEGYGSKTNNVAAIFVGSKVKPGVQTATAYTHYSLLSTTEAALGLGPLTTAAPITDIWH